MYLSSRFSGSGKTYLRRKESVDVPDVRNEQACVPCGVAWRSLAARGSDSGPGGKKITEPGPQDPLLDGDAP